MPLLSSSMSMMSSEFATPSLGCQPSSNVRRRGLEKTCSLMGSIPNRWSKPTNQYTEFSWSFSWSDCSSARLVLKGVFLTGLLKPCPDAADNGVPASDAFVTTTENYFLPVSSIECSQPRTWRKKFGHDSTRCFNQLSHSAFDFRVSQSSAQVRDCHSSKCLLLLQLRNLAKVTRRQMLLLVLPPETLYFFFLHMFTAFKHSSPRICLLESLTLFSFCSAYFVSPWWIPLSHLSEVLSLLLAFSGALQLSSAKLTRQLRYPSSDVWLDVLSANRAMAWLEEACLLALRSPAQARALIHSLRALSFFISSREVLGVCHQERSPWDSPHVCHAPSCSSRQPSASLPLDHLEHNLVAIAVNRARLWPVQCQFQTNP